MKYRLTWSGLADNNYYEAIAKYCLPSWEKLPGKKFVIHDANSICITDVEIIPWEHVPNNDANFLKTNPKKKPWNFWRKMQSQVWAIRNLKDCDFFILLDTDIEILDFDELKFERELDNLRTSGNVWATGKSQLQKLDAGFIIIDMQHPKVSELTNYYENIWESNTITTLPKGYDGDAVESMFPIYPSYRLSNRDYGNGLHIYAVGAVHWGSKIPKALRAAWEGDGKSLVEKHLSEIVIKQYKNEI
jgi:hypothetical protein